MFMFQVKESFQYLEMFILVELVCMILMKGILRRDLDCFKNLCRESISNGQKSISNVYLRKGERMFLESIFHCKKGKILSIEGRKAIIRRAQDFLHRLNRHLVKDIVIFIPFIWLIIV